MVSRDRLGRTLLASCALATSLGAFGVPALAQAESQATTATGVEDIIVSARRRNESIQDVPVAVTAISPAQLANMAAPDIRDLVGRTPNLVIDPVNAGPSAAAISIRGISFEDIEKSFDPAVGVLVDDVYIGTNTGQLLDFFDFESVEVLRGPQGTLFGRNTTAGVIRLQRTKPTGEFGVRALGTIGDYGRRDVRLVVNMPKIADLISLKGFWIRAQSDDFYDNQVLGEDYGGRKYDNYGIAARVERGGLDVVFTWDRVKERSEIDQPATSRTPDITRPFPGTQFNPDLICLQVPVTGVGLVRPTGIPGAQCDRNTGGDLYTTFSNVPGFARNDGDNFTINGSLELGELTLSSVTGWRDSDEIVRQDFDSTSIDFFDTQRVQTYRQFSQELRLSGDLTDALDFVTGLYYFNSRYTLDQTTFFGPFLQAAAGLPAQGGNIVDHRGKSTALFADVQWTVTEDLRLSVGGRYTWDEKSIFNDFLKTGLPQFIADESEKWNQFTPRASLDYSFGDNLVYASYSRGYRAGGFNGRGQSAESARTPYDPETVDSFELGLKTQFLDNRVTLNVAGFLTKYNDKQEEIVRAIPGAGQETLVLNAAKATIKGLEAELRVQATEGLSFSSSLGLLDAKYDEFQTQLVQPDGVVVNVDASERDLRRTPDVSFSLIADWAIPVGELGNLDLAASYRHVSSFQTTIVGDAFDPTRNDPRGLAQARNLVDASAAMTFDLDDIGKMRVAVFGRNLTDDRGLNSTLPVGGLFTFSAARPPRTFGMEVGFEF
jgi:iron complex outermembrane recepter protein